MLLHEIVAFFANGFDQALQLLCIFPQQRALLAVRGLPIPLSIQYIAGNLGNAQFSTRAYAVFANIAQELTDDFRVTLGGRYT